MSWMRNWFVWAGIAGLLWRAGVLTGAAWATEAAFEEARLPRLDEAVVEAIAAGNLPGAVLWLERPGSVVTRVYGNRALVPEEEPMTADTLFDAASLTKVVATTPSIMRLVEAGRLEIDEPVRTYLPEFNGEGTETITLRHLLTHTSGLRPGLSLRPSWEGYETAITKACQQEPQQPPGTRFRYSDINFILLGEVVRRVSGRSLDQFAREEIFAPLEMKETGFRPPTEVRQRVAPTEQTEDGVLRGVVHDPTARRMGGVAGHAGLFTTARDLARYARMLLHLGQLEGRRVLRPETVRWMTTVQSPPEVEALRGLGWDIDSPYSSPRGALFPKGSYGHTGWTGTSLWVDPFSRTFLILLSNRNHPTEEGSVVALRREVATRAAEAVRGVDFEVLSKRPLPSTNTYPAVPTPEVAPAVRNGIDVLVRDGFKPLKKKRVGLITNQTGVDARRRSTIDLLYEAEGVDLRILFSPEHGIRGQRDAPVDDEVDPETGLQVISLYGERRAPEPEHFLDLDALVFDIQDIGCRFYTYISTLRLCLEAAAKAGVEFVVLDRVNPINGIDVEGPVHEGPPSFIATHALPLRHGMTVGELARMFTEERDIDAALTIVPLEGWRREMWFDETGLPWVNPSPNMRNLKQATLYPGVGLLEKALSVGRGTDTPFEVFGAPYIDEVHFAAALNEQGLPGVRFIPIRFTPASSVFAGEPCGGVYVALTDRDRLASVEVGLAAAAVLQRHYVAFFETRKFNILLLEPSVLEGIRDQRDVGAIKAGWEAERARFLKRRERFLLYR